MGGYRRGARAPHARRRDSGAPDLQRHSSGHHRGPTGRDLVLDRADRHDESRVVFLRPAGQPRTAERPARPPPIPEPESRRCDPDESGREARPVREGLQGESLDALVGWGGGTSWAWGLYPVDEGHTRLITRVRLHYDWRSPSILFHMLV